MTRATKVVIALWTCLAVGAVILGEQATRRENPLAKTTVVYWEKWTGSEGDAMRKVVNDFNKSQDKIYVQYLSISAIDQKTLLATSGGTPPDIAGIWQEQVAQFADAGALADLTPMATPAGLTKDYYIEAYWNPLEYRGKLWALPCTPASVALHVRPDRMPPEADTPEEFPKTIEELDKLAFRISKKRPDGTIEFAGFMPSSPGWWNWAWGAKFGGKLWDGKNISVNSKEMVRAFEWIRTYAEKFGAKEAQSFQSGFGNFASPQDPFMTGKTGIEQNGVWKANFINVHAKGTPWFAVPFPYPADHPELEGHSAVSQDILVIPRGAKYPKEAFEFLKYVQRQDVMEGLCLSHGKNSPLTKVSEDFFNRHPNKSIRLFDKMARSPRAITPPSIGIWKQTGSEIGVAFQEVTTLSKTPKQALDDAQKRIDTIWATYKAQVLD
jgi:multiple sugar transport system substrate-binding protein